MNLLNPPRLDKSAIKRSFDRQAAEYDIRAVLQKEVLSRLLDRLQYIKLQPRLIVDLGCGTGGAIAPLRKKYKGSSVLALDLAPAMLQISKKQYGLLSRKWLVNADMEHLPLKDGCVDLMFSSLALQWSNDLAGCFREFRRAGRQGGLLMFATFGLNTLHDLRESWNRIDSAPRVHQFLDMHDIGDMMLSSGLSQPVLDQEQIILQYRAFNDLLSDIRDIGASNAERNRSRGLLTARKLQRLEQQYRELAFQDGLYSASYEIVYGHAWF